MRARLRRSCALLVACGLGAAVAACNAGGDKPTGGAPPRGREAAVSAPVPAPLASTAAPPAPATAPAAAPATQAGPLTDARYVEVFDAWDPGASAMAEVLGQTPSRELLARHGVLATDYDAFEARLRAERGRARQLAAAALAHSWANPRALVTLARRYELLPADCVVRIKKMQRLEQQRLVKSVGVIRSISVKEPDWASLDQSRVVRACLAKQVAAATKPAGKERRP